MPGSERCRRAGSLLLAPRVLGVAALGPVTCVYDVLVSQRCAEHPQKEVQAWLQRVQGLWPHAQRAHRPVLSYM